MGATTGEMTAAEARLANKGTATKPALSVKNAGMINEWLGRDGARQSDC
jgi:hypothetical protein